MLSLRPIPTNAVSIISEENSTGERRQRKRWLGHFVKDVTIDQIDEALKDRRTLLSLIGSYTLESGGSYKYEVIPRSLTEGVIFENVDECVQCILAGLSPEELFEYTLMTE